MNTILYDYVEMLVVSHIRIIILINLKLEAFKKLSWDKDEHRTKNRVRLKYNE